MDDFQITARADGSIHVVEIAGQFDLAACDDFLARGRARSPRAELVVVDLRGATFLDSHALSALIALHQSTARDAVRLAIIRPAGRADRIFTLTGMDGHLPVYDDAVPLRAELNYG